MKQRSSIRYLIGEGFKSVQTNRLMSVASIAVLVACLVIIGSAVLLFLNVQASIEKVEQQNVIMVFLNEPGQDEERNVYLERVKNELNALANVKDCTLVPREEGFQDILSELDENAAILDGTDSSFLPDGYRITVEDMASFNATVESIRLLPEVLRIRQNSDLAERLLTVSQSITYISFGIIVLLLLVALFIIANTIRITMHSRRLEISIMKAVGATNWFIRTPFLVEGIVLGVLAALLGLGVLFLLYTFAGEALLKIFELLNSELVSFGSYALPLLLGFLLVSVFTGCLGSVFSIGKYLKEQGGVVLNEEK